MRYPAAETAEKHSRILEAASSLFRKRGFAGVSVGEVMRATGLTHGPFYNHFASKEALIEESVAHASVKSLEEMDIAGMSQKDMLAYVQRYLTPEHRDTPEQGCLMAALAGDIGREEGVRSTLTTHLTASLDRFIRYLPWQSKKTARKQSIQMLSAMVGAVVLSRAVNDEAFSNEILRDVREGLRASLPPT